jgi:uncharacterized protein
MIGNTPLRAVVDTNVFLSGLIVERGNPFNVLEAWRAGRFVLVSSPELFQELERVLSRPEFARRLGAELIAGTIRLVGNRADAAETLGDLPVEVRDPKDEMVLAAALAAGADYIVTGDQDLLILEGDESLGHLRIVTPRVFLEELVMRE